MAYGHHESLPDFPMVTDTTASAAYDSKVEGNVIARWGTAGLDPFDVLFGASVMGMAIALPLALATGTFIDPRPPWGAPDVARLIERR